MERSLRILKDSAERVYVDYMSYIWNPHRSYPRTLQNLGAQILLRSLENAHQINEGQERIENNTSPDKQNGTN